MTFAQPFTDYEILDRVGAGAMGTVYKARHKRLNRIVALKVLKPSLARDSRYVDRLKREARIVASLSHPNIVTGFDLGEEAGYHFFVMEFVEGKSLRAMMTQAFAEGEVRKVARQVAQALDHAYQRGVIHRDIKPGNILIDEAGNVKLTDMGLAKGPADLTLTRDGATVGTPQYISPEQARNPHDVDVRTDLYSLGATLYHMATGVPPFRGDTMAELITNVLHELPVSPRAINSALSEGMSLVIRKLLAKDLRVRYQTPRDLLDDLDRLDRSMPPQIDPARLSQEEGERVRWWPRALAVLAAASLLGGAWWIGMQMRAPGGAAPTAAVFLADLRRQLAALPSLGARLEHVRAVEAPPAGSLPELQLLERSLQAELQQQLDGVAVALGGDGFAALSAWLADPAVWPDRARVLREQVQPRLQAATGFALDALPKSLRRVALDDLLAAIDRGLADRDRALLERFDRHLQTKVGPAARLNLRADDFVRAGQLWQDALTSFCSGLEAPLLETLHPDLARQLRDRHALAVRQAEERELVPAESRVAAELLAEVDTICQQLAAAVETGLAPETAAERLVALQQDVQQRWPGARAFRVDRNPWGGVERRFAELRGLVELAAQRRADERFAGRCNLVWRTFCHGRTRDAQALLPATAGGRRDAVLQQHRDALQAAAAVEQAVVEAVGRASQANQGVVGFLRGGEAVEVRAEPIGGGWRLVGTALAGGAQPPRDVQLGELRFSRFLAQLPKDRDVLQSVAEPARGLGAAIWRFVGDDLDGIEAVVGGLPAAQREFLLAEVWPRIVAVRGERDEVVLDRSQLFAQLRAAREAAAQRGDVGNLGNLVAQCEHLIPAHERAEAEEAELRAARKVLAVTGRLERLGADLHQAAPRGAEIDVRSAGDELVAMVAFAAPALERVQTDGWQRREGRLEFFGGGAPWSDFARRELRCLTGLPTTALRLGASLDCVLPSAAIGTRFWVLEFRGVAVAVVVTADDVVRAAFVEGDLRDEANVQAAFARAVATTGLAAADPRLVVVPGAVHRFAIELQANGQRTSARVRVTFEGADLLPPTRRDLDPERAPSFAVHPRQELAVQRIEVRATGL